MAQSSKRRRRRSLFGLLLLLLFLLLFKLNAFLPGLLPGGGHLHDEPQPDPIHPGMLEILVVRGPNRAPVQGATVRLAGLDGEERSLRTRRNGKMWFEGLSAQPYRIDAEGESEIGSAWSEPGRSIRMVLHPRLRRTGTVRGTDGQPRSGTAMLLDRDAGLLAIGKVGPDGRYELEDVPGAVSVCVWPDRGAPGATSSGDILIGEGDLVRGRIPVPGTEPKLKVFALIPDRNEDRLIPLRAEWQVGPDGSYEGRLPAGSRAWIVHDGAPYPVGVTTALRGSAAIEGVVTDGADRPLAGATVLARPLRDGLPVAPFPIAQSPATGADGKFRVEPLGEGSYELELSAPGRARMVIHEVATGSPPSKIVMTRGFRIRGRVLDPDGNPVRDAEVYALATPDDAARYPEAATKTLADGRFVLDRIGGDYARVRVRKEGFAEATMMKVPANGNVNIRLRETE